MNFPNQFTITDEHVKLMRAMYVDNASVGGEGAPKVDQRRPYGSTDITLSIARVLGVKMVRIRGGEEELLEEDEKRLARLHQEMSVVLQIVLYTGEAKPGYYRRTSLTDSRAWERHDPPKNTA